MNILSLSHIQAQTAQSDLSQLSPTRRDGAEKPASFADLLRDARNDAGRAAESEQTDRASEKPLPRDEEQIAKRDEGEASQLAEKKDETVPSENGKAEKIARNRGSDDEKNDGADERLAENRVAEEIGEQLVAAALSQNQGAEAETAGDFDIAIALSTEIASAEALDSASDAENAEISDNMLSWLKSSAKSEAKSDEISAEDFASLIDSAAEFVPGTESESEKLETAQNLALSDPEFFLDAVENAQFAEVSARGAAKSEVDFVDSGKKIASEKSAEKKGAKLSVHDLRTHHLFGEDSAKIASDKIVQKSAEKKEINLSMQKQADGNLQMTMELVSRAQENITSSSAQAAGANGSDFQAMLSNAVQENAPDFVKAGNIVLKDNNQGTINLVLRPEGLGNVKISLNLDDKNLSAQITVQTKEAMEAFRESISSLKQAFTESGFETGSFDLNFSQNQNQQGFAQGGNDGQNQNAGILAHKSYGDFVTASAISGDAGDAFAGGEYSVNIVA